MSFSNIKFIYFFQLSAVILTALGVLPPETSLVLTAVLIGYILISPIEDSLLLIVASIPLYVALPFTDNFDSMANWRIIILVLFLKWLKEPVRTLLRKVLGARAGTVSDSGFSTKPESDERGRTLSEISSPGKSSVFSCRVRTGSCLVFYILFFTFFTLLSLIAAPYPIIGIKKLIFLANIFLLFVLVKNVANTEEKIISLMKAVGLSAVITLVIGYSQFISVFFYSLYEFWQYWAQNIITVFYGRNLGGLLSVSNTWFSYYQDLPPTLRMFSVFPDSHSFALSIVITLPILLTFVMQNIPLNPFRIIKGGSRISAERSEAHLKYGGCKVSPCLTRKGLSGIFIAILLLPIIFSGSRGVWVSALAALAAGIFYSVKVSKKFRLTVFVIALLFMLFPIASFILGKSQEAELRRINSEDAAIKSRSVSFERFASVIDANETSNKGRLEIWRDTLNSVKGNLFFGVGFGNFPIILSQDVSAAKKGSSAHNIYLDILAEIGIFGLAAFVLIFYEISKTAYKVSKSENKIFSFFASMFFIYLFWIAAYGLFDVVLFNDKVLLLFMATFGILYAIKNHNL